MKALSLLQPWATLVALGKKRFETRGWDTPYRGPLLIHASARFPSNCIMLCYEEPFYSALKAAGIHRLGGLPLGAIIAKTSIVDTCRTNRAVVNAIERAFGDYGPRRYALELGPVEETTPVLASGALSLWTPTREVLAALDIEEPTPPLLQEVSQ